VPRIPPDVWLEEFFREYLLGNVYSVPVDYWTDNAHGTFTIGSDEDVLKTFSDSYPELGARLYSIELEHPNMDPAATIIFTATGGAARTTVFKYRGTSIEVVGSGTGPLSVPDVSTLADEGWDLLALVTNIKGSYPFASTDDIELKIEIITNSVPYNSCGVMVEFLGRYHAEVNLPDTSYSYDYDSDASLGTWETYPGTFSGNTFTGTYSRSYGTLTITGTVTATLDPNRTTVTSVNWSEQSVSTQGSGHTANIAFSGTDIPVDYSYTGTIIFQFEGEETIGHISSLAHTQVASEGLSFSLTSHECTGDSRIWVRFSTE
jgi:hypothetical protein